MPPENDAQHPFLKSWGAFAPNKPPFVLPEDRVGVEKIRASSYVTHASWDEYIQSKDVDRKRDSRLHLGLLPQPFHGPITRAKVFILLQNPGLDPADYYAELVHQGFRQPLIDGYRVDRPFFFLDDRFAWHSGFRWWNRKLSKVISAVASHRGISRTEARQAVAEQVAAIELVPYHSRDGVSDAAERRLRSVELARSFVMDVVLPRALQGECGVVVARRAKKWAIPPSPNVVVYEQDMARSAPLGPKTQGGALILRMLNVIPVME